MMVKENVRRKTSWNNLVMAYIGTLLFFIIVPSSDLTGYDERKLVSQ